MEDVSAYLNRPSALPGTEETLVVLLKKVIPKHFRTQYNDFMHQWGWPKTGNSFVDYMKRKLTYKIDESEENDKKDVTSKKTEGNSDKKAGTKVLGKLYSLGGRRANERESGLSSDGSTDEGECLALSG